jgi:hypothetical protein
MQSDDQGLRKGFSRQMCLVLSHTHSYALIAGVVPASLGVLNLSFNKLQWLPAALGNAPVLQQLYLANNQ